MTRWIGRAGRDPAQAGRGCSRYPAQVPKMGREGRKKSAKGFGTGLNLTTSGRHFPRLPALRTNIAGSGCLRRRLDRRQSSSLSDIGCSLFLTIVARPLISMETRPSSPVGTTPARPCSAKTHHARPSAIDALIAARWRARRAVEKRQKLLDPPPPLHLMDHGLEVSARPTG